MIGLLAHALLAYSVCRVLSWRYAWLDQQYVTLGMVRSLIPDLVKIKLLIPSWRVEQLLSIPFDWGASRPGVVSC